MTARSKNRHLFNIFGILIVGLWLVMISFLVRKVHFKDQGVGAEYGLSAEPIGSPQREWKEIYLKNRKVGYASNLIRPFQDGYFVQEEIFLKLELMGFANRVHTITQAQLDKGYLLRNFYFTMTSGVVKFNISGRVEGDELLLKTGRDAGKKTRRIKLPRIPMIGAGMGYYFRSREIRVGNTYAMPVFDPSTMAQKETVIKVAAKEQIQINRRTFEVFRLETELWGGRMTFWLDEEGRVMKEEGFMGLTLVKSSAANAPLDMEGGGEIDLYDLAAISIDRELPTPERLKYLKLKVEGVDDHMTLNRETWNGGRQRYRDGIMEVTREKPPFKGLYSLPFDGSGRGMETYLKPEFNIESDAEEVRETARKIAGDEKNPFKVARKTMEWVYDNLDKKPVVSVPSALDVLRTRVGDCNEHSTLLTALLRASGIPAKISVGLVYTRGKFFYHAWTEAFVGEWITMDATLGQMPADVTHIKLLEGNLDRQVEIAGLIGTLTLRVLDLGYD